MKSIKPGRGPSLMGGVGATFAALFGLFWTVTAASMGAPGMFPLFGLVFIGIAVFQAVYNFRNATGKNRHSLYDITEAGEEPDPLDLRFGRDREEEPPSAPSSSAAGYCPYCGAPAQRNFQFCSKCGRELPN